jgi:formylglycine-generating enzyme required for sulfatase activity/serine/threonine protein kinase
MDPSQGPERLDDATRDLLTRLGSHHGPRPPRYKLEGELARGGMGAILRVWDDDLRRHLAMKVVLGKGEAPASGRTPTIDARVLARFLEEAQVTGQLDHPGIVPVHELGIDADGRVFFTMKLVKGRDLKAIYDLVFREQEGWNETRALGVLLRVCEAMAYAHEKGVIHRDLKPANVMVGSFGEVFVMDWGLARVVGNQDTHDLRLRPASPGGTELPVTTVKSAARAPDSDSPIVTMEGDVLGTPAYMPPEQARGEIERLSKRSDVYSIGAMLYHLLARTPPYFQAGGFAGNYEVLRRARESAPEPLANLRRDVPEELVAICERAMERDPERRYPDTLALADDLRAFLEHRVVAAYETGAWAETRKWIRRNRALAASMLAAVLLLVAGLTVSLVFKARADGKAADLQTANTTIQARNVELASTTKLAQDNAAKAQAEEKLATQRANDVLSLSAIQDLKDLEDRADLLWPADPKSIPEYEAWLADARQLIEGRPADPSRSVKKRPSLAEHEAKLQEIRGRARAGGNPQALEFADGEDRWWHAQLSRLVADLHAFADEGAGGLFSSGTSVKHGWGIVKRLEFARTIEERSVTGAEAKKRWEEAVAAVARNPKYRGLRLSPQLGLLPIGEDPSSHLWEFSLLATGDPPERGDDGKLALREETGIVLVLIPGGTFLMGVQKDDPTGPNYDALAVSDESPPHEVTLSPYFISKYEMTQGQWERFTGRNPSHYGLEGWSKAWNRERKAWTALHPVEQVTWTQCMEVTRRLGLSLPSEAQWENAARGGTETIYWTGSDLASLKDAANLSDAYGKAHGNEAWALWEPDFDDGNSATAEVGSYRANPFGLHDVVGNVWEWCLDGYWGSFYSRSPKNDPVASTEGASIRIHRGGGFSDVASRARVGLRNGDTPDNQSDVLGLRPARVVAP